MLNIAVIGLGTISPLHINAIKKNSNVKLVAVCDIDLSKKEFFEEYNFYSNIDEMIENEKIDCAHVCLPHYLHVPVIIKLAKAGVNVFTEKPLGLTFEQCTELFELEKTYNVKIGVCLQNRYNLTSVAMKKFVDEQTFGELLGSKGIVTWHRDEAYYNESPWRSTMKYAGGGCMINQSIHTLDLLSYIVGDFENIHAKIANFSLSDYDIEDSVMARLKYKDKDIYANFISTISYCDNSPVEIELAFEKATLKMTDCKLYKIDENGMELIVEDLSLTGYKDYYGASHIVAIDAFYDAIINNTNQYISVQKGAYSIKLINTIVKSSNENKKIEI